MSEKLNSCPFKTGNCDSQWVEGPDFGDYWAACSCGATGPTAGTEEEAIKAWNQRKGK